jgi:hypothetical protein
MSLSPTASGGEREIKPLSESRLRTRAAAIEPSAIRRRCFLNMILPI